MAPPIIPSNCIVCGKVIYCDKWGHRNKTCSCECKIARIKQTRKRVIKYCEICGTIVKPQSLSRKRNKTCSNKCFRELKKRQSFQNSNNYSAIHKWIVRNWGKADCCELCNIRTAKSYEWSNKNHEYSRKKDDWWKLCKSCHSKYDIQNGLKKDTILNYNKFTYAVTR